MGALGSRWCLLLTAPFIGSVTLSLRFFAYNLVQVKMLTVSSLSAVEVIRSLNNPKPTSPLPKQQRLSPILR